MTQTLAINLGSTKAGLTTLAVDLLDAAGDILDTLTEGYVDQGGGSYTWTIDAAAEAVAARVYTGSTTLLVMAIQSAAAALNGTPGAVTLAQVKEFLRLVDDGGQDNLLTSLLIAAQEYIVDQCDLLEAEPEDWPELPKVAVKMLVAGWYSNPEAFSTQQVQESPAVRSIIRIHQSWVPA